MLRHRGEELSISEWASRLGIGRTAIYARLRMGWSITRTLETSRIDPVSHGAARSGNWTAEYKAWRGMKARCLIPGASGFYKYGARGIEVYPEWVVDFEAFFRHVGERPTPSHSLERIDNSGNYEPGNVRWATATEQARNRRSARFLTFRGESKTLSEWSERTGMSPHNIKHRVDVLGWTVEKALSTPKGRRFTLDGKMWKRKKAQSSAG
jgi:hypothetical protein